MSLLPHVQVSFVKLQYRPGPLLLPAQGSHHTMQQINGPVTLRIVGAPARAHVAAGPWVVKAAPYWSSAVKAAASVPPAFICTCTGTHTYACTCTCTIMYKYVYLCMYAPVHVHEHVYLYVHAYAVHAHVHVHVHVHIHIHVHVDACIHIHVYVHVHVHEYTHTCIFTCACACLHVHMYLPQERGRWEMLLVPAAREILDQTSAVKAAKKLFRAGI